MINVKFDDKSLLAVECFIYTNMFILKLWLYDTNW